VTRDFWSLGNQPELVGALEGGNVNSRLRDQILDRQVNVVLSRYRKAKQQQLNQR